MKVVRVLQVVVGKAKAAPGSYFAKRYLRKWGVEVFEADLAAAWGQFGHRTVYHYMRPGEPEEVKLASGCTVRINGQDQRITTVHVFAHKRAMQAWLVGAGLVAKVLDTCPACGQCTCVRCGPCKKDDKVVASGR